jgi:hypothetical protein
MTQEHLERIHLLSRRFQELQGLRVALAGALMALVVGGYVVTAPTPSNNGAMIALLVSFALIAPGVWSLNRYYTTKFGRQVSGPRRNPWPILLLWWALFAVAWTLNARFEAIPAGAPSAATVAVASIWIAIRDWPWRAYYLLAPVAVGSGFIASAPVTGVLEPGMTLGTLFLLLGASMVPIGLLDHLQLVRLVKDVRESQPSVERVSSSPDQSPP